LCVGASVRFLILGLLGVVTIQVWIKLRCAAHEIQRGLWLIAVVIGVPAQTVDEAFGPVALSEIDQVNEFTHRLRRPRAELGFVLVGGRERLLAAVMCFGGDASGRDPENLRLIEAALLSSNSQRASHGSRGPGIYLMATPYSLLQQVGTSDGRQRSIKARNR